MVHPIKAGLIAALVLGVLPAAAAQQAASVTAEPDAPRLAPIDWDTANRDRAIQERRDSAGAAAAPVNRLPNNAVIAQGARVPPLANPNEASLDSVELPVLLPRIAAPVTSSPGGEPGMYLYTRPGSYSATFHIAGITVNMRGSRLIHSDAPDELTARNLAAGRDADGVRYEASETGAEAVFSRYGAAYALALECQMEDDPRCAADGAVIRGLVDSLSIEGGAP